MLKYALLVIIVAAAGLLAYVRFAPSDPVAWHIDPLTAALPVANGWLVRPESGNALSPVSALDPAATLAALDAIAMATPRTIRLAGSVAEGRITYVTRSMLIGFPDYTTVATVTATGGTALVIYARQRFGEGDQGVNRARVEAWLARMPAG